MPHAPLIAVLSRNAVLVADLSDRLGERSRVMAADLPGDLLQDLKAHAPDAVVLDFLATTGHGHAETRLIEQLAALADRQGLIVLVPACCPEPLERALIERHLPHLRGPVTTDALAELLTERLGGDDDETDGPVGQVSNLPAGHSGRLETCPTKTRRIDAPTGPARGPSAEAATVLDGITRRFETNSPRLKAMLADLEIAARHNVTILLIGETGSGKTFLSKLIHEISPRCHQPFLHVACGALPADLIESELFGHVKGSFTSAHADKEGKFLAAGGGTILLDEIDALGPEQQVKLLKVIETGEFEPVGSNRTLVSRARLVVASNLPLQPLVEQGKFRPDLYYRLNMLKFELPPLRERKEDILPLARTFIRQMAEKHDVVIDAIDPSLLQSLLAYPWPGNVRELENVIQRAVIFCRDGRLAAPHLPSHILSGTAGPTNDPSVRLTPGDEAPAKRLTRQMSLTEREIIEQALFRNQCSRTNTARDLGISRVTLYNKMKKYGIFQ